MDAPFPPRCRACFTPVERLAAGGFGEVWIAKQAGLDRRVAVKVLSALALTSAADVQRFLAEAKVTASLAHPSIVVVHDHDCEEGVPWIAYELLPGPSLRTRLEREGALAEADALAIAAQVAGALEAAHAAGIVHRDVKPDNVLGAGPGRVKLTDFGIAKWAGAEVKTATGVVLGTPAYLAPEAIRGDPVGPSADLYALGVMLHELLSGRPPFEDESVVLLMQRHLTVPPRDLRARGVRGAVAQLVQRLLAKDPAERPASGGEVRRELEALEARADGTAPVVPQSARRAADATTRPVSRGMGSVTVAAPAPRAGPRLAAAGAGLALALAIGAGAWWGRGAVRTSPSPSPSAIAATPAPDRVEAEALALEAELVHVPPDRLEVAQKRALEFCVSLARRKARKPAPLPPHIAFRALSALGQSVRELQAAFDATLVPVPPPEMAALERRLAHLLDGLEPMGWVLMTRPGPVQYHTQLLSIAHNVIDSGRLQAFLDPKGKVRRMAERWEREHPGSWIAADAAAGVAREADDPFAELVARERALELFEREHMAQDELELGVFEGWAALVAEAYRLQGRLLSPRAQLALVARYARQVRGKRWQAAPDFQERRNKLEATLSTCELAGVTGRAVLATPDAPLPDWTAESRFVEATLAPRAGDPGGDVPHRALLWCAALSLHARPLPAELAQLPVQRAVDDVVDFFKRVSATSELSIHAKPDELRRTHAKVFRMLDALWPVVLDRPSAAQEQAELAMHVRFHLKNDRFALLDRPAYAAGLVARWRERWKGRWVAPLFAPRRGVLMDSADMARRWIEALDGLERELIAREPADPVALKYWAIIASHAAGDLAKAGLAAEHRALLGRLDALGARHAAAVASDAHTKASFSMSREAIVGMLGAGSAGPLPAGSPTSILGASDDPTPRRDRPGLQEVR